MVNETRPVFVLQIRDQAILAFEAGSILESYEIGRERWFQKRLRNLSISGRAAWNGRTRLHFRMATAKEFLRVRTGKLRLVGWGQIRVGYLIKVDEQR